MGTLIRLLMVAICIGAAAPSPLQAGESPGSWRGRWWNYYERGVIKGEQGDWEAARADFSAAIRLRDRDQRRARTYGMHFIDYFPHRELGIAWYYLGKPEQAATELEASLAVTESAKAAHYLNTVRRTLLQRKTGLAPPVITITSPPPQQATRETAVTVSGRVSADALVAYIRINGTPYRFDLAAGQKDFSREVALDDGDGHITVEAGDLLGRTARSELTVPVDRDGPSFSLSSIDPLPGYPGKYRIRALLHDRTGIAGIRVNGEALAVATGEEVPLDTVAALPGDSGRVRIEAVDLLGNLTTMELDPERERTARARWPEAVLVAMNGIGGIFPTDRDPPVIRLKDAEDLPAAYIDRYYVAGEASDASQVERVSVNGRELPVARGRKVFFSTMIRLKEGDNRIIVEATDRAGNRSSASFTVRRIIPATRLQSARMSLSVLPFQGRITTAAIQELADDFLIAALSEQKRFQVVEREKLKQLLLEQKLAREKLTDPEHSIRAGRLLSADAVLSTTLVEGQKSLEVVTRLISTETAEVIETRDAYVEDKSLSTVRELMEGVAARLSLGLPVVEGLVVRREKEVVFSDLGSASGVRTSMPAAVYRRGRELRHPVTGVSLGWDMVRIGDGTIEDVRDGFSRIRLREKSASRPDVQSRDIVITR